MSDLDLSQALHTCQELAEKYNVNAHILGVDLENEELIFRYRAPKRVSFRTLERELNRHYKRGVKFAQISPRQIAAQIPGCGKCGRPLCCRTYLTKLPTIPTEILTELGLTGPIENYTGSCGRLLCCLAYETDHPEKYFKVSGEQEESLETQEESGGEETLAGRPPAEQSVVTSAIDTANPSAVEEEPAPSAKTKPLQPKQPSYSRQLRKISLKK